MSASCSSFNGAVGNGGGECQQCVANGCAWDASTGKCGDGGDKDQHRDIDVQDFFSRASACQDTLNVCSVKPVNANTTLAAVSETVNGVTIHDRAVSPLGNFTFGWVNSTTTVPKDYFCYANFSLVDDDNNFVLDGITTQDNALYG